MTQQHDEVATARTRPSVSSQLRGAVELVDAEILQHERAATSATTIIQ